MYLFYYNFLLTCNFSIIAIQVLNNSMIVVIVSLIYNELQMQLLDSYYFENNINHIKKLVPTLFLKR